MRKLSIIKSPEIICSCNSCGARNYDSTNQLYNDSVKKVDTIFEVRIGCMINRLCPDCLVDLVGTANEALLEV